MFTDGYEWAVSKELQQSNVSDVSLLIPLISITSAASTMSPIPLPRTKQLRRLAAAVFMTCSSEITASSQHLVTCYQC